MRRLASTAVFFALAFGVAGNLTAAAKEVKTPAAVPARPEALKFPELTFEVPDASRYRYPLDSQVVAFVAEDHSLPLVDIQLTVRGGSYLLGPDEGGLAEFTGSLMRAGGTARLTAEEFDEEAEFLAANISSFGGDTHMGARVSCITPVLDACLDLFFDMVRTPRFQQSRLDNEKGRALESLKQRNDDAQDILSREWDWALYGEDYFAARKATAAQIEGLQRVDLERFHRRVWRPEGMIISIAGDIDAETILPRIEGYLEGWPREGEAVSWPPPEPTHQPRPGFYYVDKEIPQGKVYFGHPIPQVKDWNHPDLPALQIMNQILGGGGFTSRIVKRVRSDEGLAYSAGSFVSEDSFWPGQFRVGFQSKSPTVALAIQISLEEIRRIQDEKVSAEEIAVARGALIEAFPRRFESAQQIAGTFAYDETLGRSQDYWKTWRERVRSVTAEDIQRVARAYLKTDQLIYLVVGDWATIAAGDADHRAKIETIFPSAPERLPLRDPLTLKPLP
jgi:predicted Zn-dependent peptidase